MKKAKKALLLVLCAALLVSASVMGTVAYLTSQESVENTFTVGNIAIKLDEAVVGDDGQAVAPENRTEDGNEYHMLPNMSYDKDPTVWVKEGSEEAYIRMVVTVKNYGNMLKAFDSDATYDNDYIVDAATALPGSTGQMVVLDKLVDRNYDKWECVQFVQDGDTATYVFNYCEKYTATADDKDGTDEYDGLPALFTEISVPAEIDNKHLAYLNETTITVTAQAIQTAGFNSVEEAWEAFPAN